MSLDWKILFDVRLTCFGRIVDGTELLHHVFYKSQCDVVRDRKNKTATVHHRSVCSWTRRGCNELLMLMRKEREGK